MVTSLAYTRTLIGWNQASQAAKSWWEQLEFQNKDKPDLVLALCDELLRRNVLVEDFFWICCYSGKITLKENLAFLDCVSQQ